MTLTNALAEYQRARQHLREMSGDLLRSLQKTVLKKAWAEIADGHKLEIVRPHAEAGLDHSLMGIGIWSADKPL